MDIPLEFRTLGDVGVQEGVCYSMNLWCVVLWFGEMRGHGDEISDKESVVFQRR